MSIYKRGQVVLNKYRVEKQIGQGAFGEVYLATHLELNAPRALKVLRKDFPGMGSEVFERYGRRFRLEAHLGALLTDPHVIQVHDLEMHGKELLLSMEYAVGGSLQDWIDHNRPTGIPMEIPKAVCLLRDLAEALIALHAIDIVHRDIKPSNILFDHKGSAKLGDLGVAQTSEGGITHRTDVNLPLPKHPGTPAYMSPEQASSIAYLTPASDIYSLGVVLFQTLTFRSPKNLPARTRLSSLRPDAPAWLDELLAQMLERDPEKRPFDGSALLKKLDAALGQAATIPVKGAPSTPSPVEEIPCFQEEPATAGEAEIEAAPPGREDQSQTATSASLPERPDPRREQKSQPLAAQAGLPERLKNPPPSTEKDEPAPVKRRKGRGGLLVFFLALLFVAVGAILVARGDIKLPLALFPVETAAPQSTPKDTTSPPIPSPTRGGAGEGSPASTLTTPLGVTSSPASTRPPNPTAGPTLSGIQALTATPVTAAGLLPPPCSEAGLKWVSPIDGMTLVCVPAGPFTMGANDVDRRIYPSENPERRVTLPPYWVDQTEVTNAQYRKCAEMGKCPLIPHDSATRTWYYENDKNEYKNYPVVWASWDIAKAYCEWAGRRLLTESEWEKAARGIDGRVFPWGNQGLISNYANFADKNSLEKLAEKSHDDGYIDTSPVGNYPLGVSPFGALDMGGNVWEWVSDLYYGKSHILRGGSFRREYWLMRTSSYSIPTDKTANDFGIRCGSNSPPVIPTATPTQTPTLTPTVTLIPTITLSPTITLTPTVTPVPSLTPTPTVTPTRTNTPTPTVVVKPEPPAGLSYSLNSYRQSNGIIRFQIWLGWQASPPPVLGYKLSVYVTGGPSWVEIPMNGRTNNQYYLTDPSLIEGRTITMVVVAYSESADRYRLVSDPTTRTFTLVRP